MPTWRGCVTILLGDSLRRFSASPGIAFDGLTCLTGSRGEIDVYGRFVNSKLPGRTEIGIV
jgi:hypothetical protein